MVSQDSYFLTACEERLIQQGGGVRRGEPGGAAAGGDVTETTEQIGWKNASAASFSSLSSSSSFSSPSHSRWFKAD